MASGFVNEDTEIQGGIMMVHSSKGPRPYTVVWTLSHLPLKKTNVLKSGLELRVFVSELSNVLRLAGTFLEPALLSCSSPTGVCPFTAHVCSPTPGTSAPRAAFSHLPTISLARMKWNQPVLRRFLGCSSAWQLVNSEGEDCIWEQVLPLSSCDAVLWFPGHCCE